MGRRKAIRTDHNRIGSNPSCDRSESRERVASVLEPTVDINGPRESVFILQGREAAVAASNPHVDPKATQASWWQARLRRIKLPGMKVELCSMSKR